ncbi:hypothetical protein [Metamycoplasma neophronis]|uniref:DUF4064 domain-containing protein n=1 Tax=Metamycoplasma neophronis TaxID=872983 RepID=A0ABY2Z0P4_9BACT|nr:hypothetical protein [Metamycoplasma neophronis]TPR54722.1 hypothetical protein FJR74_00415 [Metamycoplasma neophronis]
MKKIKKLNIANLVFSAMYFVTALIFLIVILQQVFKAPRQGYESQDAIGGVVLYSVTYVSAMAVLSIFGITTTILSVVTGILLTKHSKYKTWGNALSVFGILQFALITLIINIVILVKLNNEKEEKPLMTLDQKNNNTSYFI